MSPVKGAQSRTSGQHRSPAERQAFAPKNGPLTSWWCVPKEGFAEALKQAQTRMVRPNTDYTKPEGQTRG